MKDSGPSRICSDSRNLYSHLRRSSGRRRSLLKRCLNLYQLSKESTIQPRNHISIERTSAFFFSCFSSMSLICVSTRRLDFHRCSASFLISEKKMPKHFTLNEFKSCLDIAFSFGLILFHQYRAYKFVYMVSRGKLFEFLSDVAAVH